MPTEPKAERKHSPLPWRIEGVECIITSSDNESVGCLFDNPDCASYEMNSDIGDANAELIVRAVNTHQMLVQALQAIVKAYSIGGSPMDMHNIASAALSAATAEREGGE